MQTSAQHKIVIPELLDMIIRELDGEDQRMLMCVSKNFFDTAGPLAWKSVPRLELIMGLLDGVQVHRKERDGRRLTITLPADLNFGRYNIYAHWVQSLHIDKKNFLEIINLGFFTRLLNDRPPLPNLRRLTASTTNQINESFQDVIDIMISPSLVGIQIALPQHPHLVCDNQGPRVLSAYDPEFLDKLKTSCPNIETIEFYLDHYYIAEHDRFTHYIPNDRTRAALSSFTNLRSFSSSAYILRPAIFSVMGELPHLESLGIQTLHWPSSVLDPQLSIPETWFPALKRLQLRRIHSEDIQTLWRQPNIVGRLVSLQIHAEIESRYTRNWVDPFLKYLPSLSPRLEDVIFHVAGRGGSVEIPRHDWDSFKGEPLLTAVNTYTDAVREGRIA
ncbi:unnamed protein product [Rhizoctonia solani]|uniref:Uncharacterized protein n=1 Tax=Rhizoctonia solani TaxID=456999 RepID=A0A8H3DXV1_9AGAM|nr:unnamed protein product [Rhizoctonia solani]